MKDGMVDSVNNVSATEEHGGVYWLFVHSRNRGGDFLKTHKKGCILGALLGGAILGMLRPVLHPHLIAVRTHLVMFAVPIVATVLFFLALKRAWSWKIKAVVTLLYFLFATGTFLWGKEAHTYVALWYRYRTLPIVELSELPATGHERIQPLNSIHSLAYEVMAETERPMTPDFVRINGEYKWTLAIEPGYPVSRIFRGIREVFVLSGTAPAPTFSNENRVRVSFETGEGLLLGRNTVTCAIRTFGLGRFFNYEPGRTTHFTDENGKMVQAVSLVRWRGIIFPRPEFGGVQLIRQSEQNVWSHTKRMLIGCGEWVRPEEVARHAFLKGQGLLPYKVSRYIANSFRFQNGFFAPMPGYHLGDIKIPDLPEDINDQPFTTYFEDAASGVPGKLYHYFALEPYDPDKQGLNTSVLVQADGSPAIFAVKHFKRGGSLTGVSAIAPKIRESRKIYDWTRNRPVEHRPFVRTLEGKKRVFWFTTVVTLKDEKGTRFIAGGNPDIVITDAAYNVPVWVNPLAPDTWEEQIKKELALTWKANER